MANISRRSFLNLVSAAIAGIAIVPRVDLTEQKPTASIKPSPTVGDMMHAGRHYWVYSETNDWIEVPDEWLK